MGYRTKRKRGKKATLEQKRTWLNLLADGLTFISCLKITNKDGKEVRLIPTDEQVEMFNQLENQDDPLKDHVFGKPRQIGSSTFLAGYLFWKWVAARTPINIAILSKDWDSTAHIMDMWVGFYESLPKLFRPKLSKDTERTKRIKKSKATIRAISSRKPGSLRSYTQTYVLLSELAFTPDSQEVLSNAYAALNGNKLIVESTANHYMDAVHQLLLSAQRGEAELGWTFFPWSLHDEYRKELPDDWQPTHEEEEYAEKFGLDQEQLCWRRLQIQKHGLAKFQREYPLTLEEAYAQSGSSYFGPDDIKLVTVLQVDALERITLADPEEDDAYAIGCDVASGRGRDYSTITVLSKRTNLPVALYRCNTISPEMFARVIQEYSVRYNNARCLVESNNWGLPVLNELRHLGVTALWKDKNDKDWTTTAKTKLMAFEELRAALRTGAIHQIDSLTMAELRSYVLDSKQLAPHVPETLPHHGDMVISLALAVQCLKHVRTPRVALPPFVHARRRKAAMSRGIGMARRY